MIYNAITWMGGLGFWVVYLTMGVMIGCITLRWTIYTWKYIMTGDVYGADALWEYGLVIGFHILVWPFTLTGMILYSLIKYGLGIPFRWLVKGMRLAINTTDKNLPKITFTRRD